MKKIDDLLLAEFQEQHENIRQVERLAFQRVQFFFGFESLLVGAMLSLASATSSFSELTKVIFALFWLLFIIGQFVYLATIYSVINMIKLDFSNGLVRLFFRHESGRNYLLFLPNIHQLLEQVPGSWEKHRDNSVLLVKFVGIVNAINLSLAIEFSIYTALILIHPDVGGVFHNDMPIVIGISLGFIILVAFLQDRLFFVRMLRSAEAATLREQREILLRVQEK